MTGRIPRGGKRKKRRNRKKKGQMLVNNATCPGLEDVPPLMPAAVLFFVFGMAIPWIISDAVRVVSVSRNLRVGGERRVRGLDERYEAGEEESLRVPSVPPSLEDKVQFTLTPSEVERRAREFRARHWKKRVAVVVMLFMAAVAGGVYVAYCFCQTIVQVAGPVVAGWALIVAIVNSESDKAVAQTHSILALLFGALTLTISFALVIVEYQNSALAWAVLIVQLYAGTAMFITMALNKCTHKPDAWGDWTSHFERVFFVAPVILIGGVPGGNTCPS